MVFLVGYVFYIFLLLGIVCLVFIFMFIWNSARALKPTKINCPNCGAMQVLMDAAPTTKCTKCKTLLKENGVILVEKPSQL